jgi:iron-sulfur cluster assembly accessory protein
MSNPIHITPVALSYLCDMCQSSSALGFRLSVKEAGCSGYRYVPDLCHELRDDDVVFKHDGLMVYIPEASLVYLEGVTVDLTIKSLGQSQLIFKNPQAEDHCGCGESFSIKAKEDAADDIND